MTKLAVIYLVMCLFLPNTKFYFLWSAIYILAILIKTKSWEKVVVFGYWPLLVYYVGQLYVFRVIQPEELNHPLYPDGRSLFFKLTPTLLFGVAVIISFLAKAIVDRVKAEGLIIVLLLAVLSGFISAMGQGVIPWWVQTGNFISDLSLIIWLWWVRNYLKNGSKNEREYFWIYFSSLLKVLILIGSALVLIQGIKGSALGLVVEQSGVLPYSGAGSDESGWLVRPIGLWSHANIAAYSILLQMWSWLLIEFWRNKRINILWKNWLIFPVVALIWLQSRSVFLAMVPILGWAGYFYKRDILASGQKIRVGGWRLELVIAVMLLVAVVISDRFWNSVTNFGSYSGWDTRSKLISVATRLVGHHLWWGVGSGNFIPVAFREDLTGVVKTFPESVHNGWMLILAEQGLAGMTVWLVFLGVFIRKWWNFSRSNIKLRWLLMVVLISQLTVMMFQPFSSILTVNIVVAMLLLGDEAKGS